MGNRTRRTLALFLFVLATLSAARARVPEAPAPKAPARLRVVADSNFPPFLFLDADGRQQGYLVDLWKRFEQHTGIAVELVAMHWSSAKDELLTGRADVIETIYRTPARMPQLDFSDAYASIPVGIYVDRRIHGVHTAGSLRGFPVGVQRGDACAERLESMGVTDLRPFDDYEQMIRAAVQRDLRIFCMDEYPAEFYLYRNDALSRFDQAFVLYTGELRRAVRKGDGATLAVVERGMALVTAPERAALRARWLERPWMPQPWLHVAGIAVAVVLALTAAMLLWVRLLRRAVASRTRELRAEEGKLRALLDAIPDAIWVKDRAGVYRECNDRVHGSFPVPRHELIGRSDDALFPPGVTAKVRATDAEALRIGGRYTYVLPVTDESGATRHYEVVKMPMRADDGGISGIVGVARDITDRLQAERELRLAAVAFRTQSASLVTDAAGVIQRVNAAFVALTGFRPDEVCGRNLALLISQNDGARPLLFEQARESGIWQEEHWIRVREGRPRLVRTSMSPVPDDTGRVAHYVCAVVDLTTEHEARANVDRVTFFDPLTELPNRNFLLRRLQHVLDDSGMNGGALLLIDLDHFKRVNDLRGHSAGDRLLRLVAERLRALLDEHAVLSRFHGGTFALLLPCEPRDRSAACPHASTHADAVRRTLQEPFALDAGNGGTTTITVSIGWTELHGRQRPADVVLEEAELAMYAAKAAGRDQSRRFEPQMHVALRRRETLAHDLGRAIAEETGELDLHLQLQVDRQGEAIGAEALLRWTRPDGERVPPKLFIPIAEERGLIVALGDLVLRDACARLVAWAARPLTRELTLSVNVSARQFAQPDFVERLRQTLARTGADPTRLKLELTETVILDDLVEVTATLQSLRALGVRISLDDFGTGYSSLSYLARLPLDQLKIDRSFIGRLHEDANNAMVAQTVVRMGRGLGLQVIAEGVETATQHQLLLAWGCDAFQGYLLARPMAAPAFEAMLRERSSIVAEMARPAGIEPATPGFGGQYSIR